MTQQNPSLPSRQVIAPPRPAERPAAEPGDLAVAISVAQKMLTAYGTVDSSEIFAYAQAHGALTESLRILLRALGVEAVDEEEAARRSVDTQFPAVAAFLATERGEGQ